MAETTQFVTTIKVRDLISAFESKSESVTVEFSRPRAKSVGNILAKNVVVRQNEFSTLDDVEKALTKLDANLNFYEVYNKAKHVGFQEQLFNILTSIVNIESDAVGTSARKKKLISKTQTLVNFLNQKLPSNANQVVPSAPTTQYKYTPYSSYIKENGAVETKPTNATSSQKYTTYPEVAKTVDVTDSGEETFVSVRKLKENFLPKEEINNESIPTVDKKFKTEQTIKIADSSTSNGYKQEEPKIEQREAELGPDEEEQLENVSVSKLRNLFEQKSEETSKGLGIFADDRVPLNNPAITSFTNTASFPYTESNLGNVRLQRSVSGNYMNYVGLLKRTDINRSKSVYELNKTSQPTAAVTNKSRDNPELDPSAESDQSLGNEEGNKNVGHVKIKQSADSSDNQENLVKSNTHKLDEENAVVTRSVKEIILKYSTNMESEVQKVDSKSIKESEQVSSIKNLKEVEVTYSTAVSVDINQETDKEQQQNVATVEGVQEVNVNYSTAENSDIPVEEKNVASVKGVEEKYVPYSVAISVNNNQEPDKEQELNVATIEGVQEVNVNYSTAENTHVPKTESVASVKGVEEVNVTFVAATSVVINQEPDKKQEQNIATVEGVQEVNVNYSTAENTHVPKTESIASVEGVEEVDVTFVITTSADVKQVEDDLHKENVSSVEGIEEEVHYATVESEDVSQNENVANVKGTIEEDVNYSSAVSGDIKQDVDTSHKENILSIEGTKEMELRFEVAETVKFLEHERIASVKGVEEVNINYSTAIPGSKDHNRDATFTEEEIDKIDVDQTLANADIVVNAEDLKNAEDEFEKLLESSEKEKINS